VKKNKDITCTIYNDDNFGAGPSGESFGNRGFIFNHTDENDTLEPENLELGSRPCTVVLVTPCVEYINIDSTGQDKFEVYLIVDAELKEVQNTLVLWSMLPTDQNTFFSGPCELVGIFDSIIMDTKGFALDCGDVRDNLFNINYAFISTDFFD